MAPNLEDTPQQKRIYLTIMKHNLSRLAGIAVKHWDKIAAELVMSVTTVNRQPFSAGKKAYFDAINGVKFSPDLIKRHWSSKHTTLKDEADMDDLKYHALRSQPHLK
ncbi:hypothetical protein PG999_000433 [Apiospora kogelbergensis]|uniref:Transposase n=1 Tax=Apiospora kogelbergensis TaxID=1337665 RepID=A0AAW0RBG3_9PEZI